MVGTTSAVAVSFIPVPGPERSKEKQSVKQGCKLGLMKKSEIRLFPLIWIYHNIM